jgi:hypothetical protein
MATKKRSISEKISGFILPGLFILAWALALAGVTPPGAVAGDSHLVADLRWLLYFAGFVFLFSSVMHSVFAKKMAASIGWQTNGFQYEIAAVSLGLGVGCFYAVYHGAEAWVAISLPIVTFLFLAGLNHLKEVFTKHNYAPNNLYILIWDFGMPLSLVFLLANIVKF